MLLAGSAAGQGRDVRVGAGVDVIHAQYMAVGSLKVGALTGLLYKRVAALGLTKDFGRATGWNAGVGGVVVGDTDAQVGTHINFLLRLSYCGESACLSGLHISHAEGLGIARHRANAGLNFLVLEYRLR